GRVTGTSFLGMLEAPIIPHPEPSPPSAEQVLEAARLAALGGIAGEVVHELNNPLFAILGLVEMLLKDAEPGSRAEHRLALVQQTGIELRELVRTFAGFARDSGEATSVELADAVAQAVAVTARAGATKDIEVTFRAAD